MPLAHRAVYRAARRVGNRHRLYCTCHARLPSPPGAVNNIPHDVAVYIALADGRCAVANFKVEFGTKFQRKVPSFWGIL